MFQILQKEFTSDLVQLHFQKNSYECMRTPHTRTVWMFQWVLMYTKIVSKTFDKCEKYSHTREKSAICSKSLCNRNCLPLSLCCATLRSAPPLWALWLSQLRSSFTIAAVQANNNTVWSNLKKQQKMYRKYQWPLLSPSYIYSLPTTIKLQYSHVKKNPRCSPTICELRQP